MLTRQQVRLIIRHSLVGILVYFVWFCFAERPQRDLSRFIEITSIHFPKTAHFIRSVDETFPGSKEGNAYARVRIPAADLPDFLRQNGIVVPSKSGSLLTDYEDNFWSDYMRKYVFSPVERLSGEDMDRPELPVTCILTFPGSTYVWVDRRNPGWAVVTLYYRES